MAEPMWPHQQAALDFLRAHHWRALVAMEMGCGKSRVAVEAILETGAQRSLILCPKSVVAVWPKEFLKHHPELSPALSVIALDEGTCTQRAERIKQAQALALARGQALVVVLNYEAATEGKLADLLRTMQWEALVCDESHRLKQHTGKRSKFVAKLAQLIPVRLGLTGTPCPHSPLDLWAQFRFINSLVFGPVYHAFRFRYAVLGGYLDKQVVGFKNMPELTAKFHAHAFRVRTADVLDLPPFEDVRRYCTLTGRTRSAYEDFARDLIAMIGEGVVTASNALVKLLRLSQFTSGFYADELDGGEHELGSEKADLLREVIEEVQEQAQGGGDFNLQEGVYAREPMVIFARFHRDLDTIHQTCVDLGLTSSELSGRRNELQEWQDGGADVMVAQLQAGGLGVDLTRARVQVYYSLNYSLGDFMQTRARIHRPGQTRPVLYLHLLAKDTIDEVVYKALERRKRVVEAVVDALRGGGREQQPQLDAAF